MAQSRVQELAARMSMSVDEFVGEMRKLGCSEPTALKIWRGEYGRPVGFASPAFAGFAVSVFRYADIIAALQGTGLNVSVR